MDDLPIKPAQLQLFSRQGCPACEDMIMELEQALIGVKLDFDVIDVDTDAQLVEKYGLRVPVLVWGHREICEHVLDYEMLDEEVLKVI